MFPNSNYSKVDNEDKAESGFDKKATCQNSSDQINYQTVDIKCK